MPEAGGHDQRRWFTERQMAVLGDGFTAVVAPLFVLGVYGIARDEFTGDAGRTLGLVMCLAAAAGAVVGWLDGKRPSHDERSPAWRHAVEVVVVVGVLLALRGDRRVAWLTAGMSVLFTFLTLHVWVCGARRVAHWWRTRPR